MFDIGQQDGTADRARVEHCPPLPPFGPAPRNPRYPHMYNRGYQQAMASAVPHVCTDQCRRR
jgi:hypothetical protein